MIIKRPGPTSDTVLVTFQLPPAVTALSAHLVGDFNGWDRHSLPLQRTNEDGVWRISLELERDRTYQFRYLVDGRAWHNDWDADAYAPNPFGGDNSVLQT